MEWRVKKPGGKNKIYLGLIWQASRRKKKVTREKE
jgi:hypothetical protein